MTLIITAVILLFMLLTDKIMEKLFLGFLYIFYVSVLVFLEIFSHDFTPSNLKMLFANAVSFKQIFYGAISALICFVIWKLFNYLNNTNVQNKQA